MTKANCPSRHYASNQECRLPKGHREIWHQTTHPTRGTLLRFRQALGTRWTQEWVPGDDTPAADGAWVTLHYVSSENQRCGTPTVAEDLDQRIAAALSAHVEPATWLRDANGASQCSCGAHYLDSHRQHVAREVSLIARVFFDGGREQGLREAADVLRDLCPEGDSLAAHDPMCGCGAAVSVDWHAAGSE